MTQLESMAARIEELGADHAAVIAVKDITFDPIYRTYCEANTCGNYGRNWRCPPDEGPIDELIEKAKADWKEELDGETYPNPLPADLKPSIW